MYRSTKSKPNPCGATHGWRTTQGFLPKLHEFCFATKLQMHCSEFHQELIHFNSTHGGLYCPYSLVPPLQFSTGTSKLFEFPEIVSRPPSLGGLGQRVSHMLHKKLNTFSVLILLCMCPIHLCIIVFLLKNSLVSTIKIIFSYFVLPLGICVSSYYYIR